MIETEQSIAIGVGIDAVWTYVSDLQRWAAIMPGYREFEPIDADDSRWVLKVGVGGLVRTVKVLVHVERWDGPGRVDFAYRLEGDPVQGSGAYTARALGPHETEITLKVQVVGGGPMAPMWEAMGGPLLPQFARSFAEQLKAKIEAEAGAAPAEPQPASPLARLGAWLRKLWAGLFTRTRRA